MTFFNPKEEVIDIELTPEGKKALSVGRFKPSYYLFFDDNVLYDAEEKIGSNDKGAVSTSETQLDLGEEGTATREQLVALQFTLNIEPNTIIEDAKIKFVARRPSVATPIEKMIIFVGFLAA